MKVTNSAREPGAPQPALSLPKGLDFETWETTNFGPPVSTPHKRSVPHPCAFFLAHGWETSDPGGKPRHTLS